MSFKTGYKKIIKHVWIRDALKVKENSIFGRASFSISKVPESVHDPSRIHFNNSLVSHFFSDPENVREINQLKCLFFEYQ